ncbi:MAG TPA: hypothetical protein VK891_06535 [Euzebyales bacterium]|nr:hypothetical protein [Euzebyales bacterium]
MRLRHLLTIPLLLVAFSFGLAPAASAQGEVDTAVSIAATLTGPDGTAKVGVSVRGTAAHLSGSGGSAHVALAAPATFAFTGALDGSVVTLRGHVVHAGVESLEGTPVTLTADVATRAITMTVGPIPGGPHAGQVLDFSGTGQITMDDPRVGAPGQRPPAAQQ